VDQLHPIEMALSEWLLSNEGDRAVLPLQPASADGDGLLTRIRQRIENQLGDRALTPDAIAMQVGVSTRSLQKLFGDEGETFTQYLRLRRLEHCRCDLGNPLLLHLSISDICRRWGFSDAAHFSRAFREQYQRSPRAYRRQSGEALSMRVRLREARSAEDRESFEQVAVSLLETAEQWVVSIEVRDVQLVGPATTLIYQRLAQTLGSRPGANADEARAAVEAGLEVAITPVRRSWQIRGTLGKARLTCRDPRQGAGTPRSLWSS
jgi:AraC-like DNA-binding protein